MKDVKELDNLASVMYSEMNMTNRRQNLSFTTINNNNNETNDAKVFSGEMLFCWPHTWLEDMKLWKCLAQRLADDVTKRFQRRIHDFKSKWISSDLVHFPLFSTPLAWRQEALASKSSPGYKKLVLWITWCTEAFLIDDVAENWREVKDHGDLIRSLARLVYEISLTKFRSTDEICENLDFKCTVKGNEVLEGYIFVAFDVFNDVKSFLEVTPALMNPSRTIFGQSTACGVAFPMFPLGPSMNIPDFILYMLNGFSPSKSYVKSTANRDEGLKTTRTPPSEFLHVARSVRYWVELQTWDGCEGYSQLLKKDLRHELRSWVVGYDLCYEFFILLDGLVVPEKVRSNFYWDKILRNTRKLGYITNDIFSVQKELLEVEKSGERLDNGVLISMEVDSLSFEEALKKCIESHNELLQDYRKECKFAFENDSIIFELSEEEKLIFNLSLKAMPIPISSIIRSSLRMPRYRNGNVQMVFTDLQPFDG